MVTTTPDLVFELVIILNIFSLVILSLFILVLLVFILFSVLVL